MAEYRFNRRAVLLRKAAGTRNEFGEFVEGKTTAEDIWIHAYVVSSLDVQVEGIRAAGSLDLTMRYQARFLTADVVANLSGRLRVNYQGQQYIPSSLFELERRRYLRMECDVVTSAGETWPTPTG